jgi:hypothetical protein
MNEEFDSIFKSDKKIFHWKGSVYNLVSKIKMCHNTYDLINADNINVFEKEKEIYGTYSIFHPSSSNFYIIDIGDLNNRRFHTALLAYNNRDDIVLNSVVFNGRCKAQPKKQRPKIIIVSSSDNWISQELDTIIY